MELQRIYNKDKKLISICPNCRFMIEKVGGCNHMTCKKCKYEWCWLCNKVYTSNHFDRTNLDGCPGKLMLNSNINLDENLLIAQRL